MSSEKKKSLGVEVSPEIKHMLDQAKQDGNSKSSVVEDAIAFWHFLCYSTEDYKTTKQEVAVFRALKRMRERFARQGADPATLASLDVAIQYQKEVLVKLEKGEYTK